MTDARSNPKSNGMNRRRLLQGLGGAGLAGLAGCSGGNGNGNGSTPTDTSTSSGGQGSTSGTLNLAQAKAPIEFDPVVLNDVPSEEVSMLIFEGLYRYGPGTEVKPEMAKGDPEVSKGGKRWVVQLKDGPKFQNGDPVTVEDVKYSFEAPVKEETENASELNMIDTITKVDESTVQFDLKYAYGAFSNTLTWAIVPKAVREKGKKKFSKQNPLGSGPFKLVEFQQGNHVTLERWDGYWGTPKPNLKRIKMVPITEPTTRITSLKTGENDVVKTIPPKLYSTVKGLGNATIEEVPGIGYFYLAFNCKEGPTANPKVREAVDYCFDMDSAVANYVEPTGVRQYSPLPEVIAKDWNMPLNEWKKIPHGKDISSAKKLFDEAGVEKSYSWKILVPPDKKREQIGISVANGLKEAGFKNASVQRLDWGAFLEKYNTGDSNDYNMYTLGWAGTPDPDAFTYYLFGRTEDTLGVTNGTYYGANSEDGKRVAKKFLQARKSTDRSKRKQLYQSAITTLLQDRPHLPAYNLKNSFGVRDNVKNFHAHPVDSFHLATPEHNVRVTK